MANIAVGFKMAGDREMQEALRSIPRELREKALAGALRAGGRPMVARARALAPVETGLLRKSLGMVLRRPKNKVDDPYLVIGARRGFKQQVTRDGKTVLADPANYAHLVEFGHYVVDPVAGTSRRKGTARELMFVLARPFLRPAFAEARGDVRNRIVKYLSGYMDRLARRLARRRATR